MIRQLITVNRIRLILADAKTEKDAAEILRRHRIRYSFSTAGGVFHIRIPARSGPVTVTRTAARSAPLRVAAAATYYPYPVPLFSWDD